MQQTVALIDTDLTDNDDQIEKTIQQENNLIYSDLCLTSEDNHKEVTTTSTFLTNSPPTTEKSNDSENETLQLQNILEIYASVMEQSPNEFVRDPSFLDQSCKINQFSSLAETPLNIDTILKNHKKHLALKFVCKWITGHVL